MFVVHIKHCHHIVVKKKLSLLKREKGKVYGVYGLPYKVANSLCVMTFFPCVGCISQELVMLSNLFKDRIWFNTPFGRGEIIIGKILKA